MASTLSILATFTIIRSTFNDFIPMEIREYLWRFICRFSSEFTLVIEETHDGSSNHIFKAAMEYLSNHLLSVSSAQDSPKRLIVGKSENVRKFTFNLDTHSEMVDFLHGVPLKWKYNADVNTTKINQYTFESRWHERWSSNAVKLDHPMTFVTLALDGDLKNTIMEDLDSFINGKEYYKKIGKMWKRSYLLHGPPGTGKSSLIAAMANHLNFDIYSMNLSVVNSDSSLKYLLLHVSNRSILVIEDIDYTIKLQNMEAWEQAVSYPHGQLQVSWLHKRLDEITEALELVNHSSTLEEDKRKNLQGTENMEKELESCQMETPEKHKKTLQIQEMKVEVEILSHNSLQSRKGEAKFCLGDEMAAGKDIDLSMLQSQLTETHEMWNQEMEKHKRQVEFLQEKITEVKACLQGSEEESKEVDVLWQRVRTTATLLTYLKSKARVMAVPDLAHKSCGIKLLEGVGLVDKEGTPLSGWSRSADLSSSFNCLDEETWLGISGQQGSLDEQDGAYIGELIESVQMITDVMEILVKRVIMAESETAIEKEKVTLGQEEIRRKAFQIENMSLKLEEMQSFAMGTNNILNEMKQRVEDLVEETSRQRQRAAENEEELSRVKRDFETLKSYVSSLISVRETLVSSEKQFQTIERLFERLAAKTTQLESEKKQKEDEVQKLMEENVRLAALLDKKEAQLLAMNEQCKVMALNSLNI
ncbi:hypothetical protein GQ457_04G021060 [Hibiscus cannabinus]